MKWFGRKAARETARPFLLRHSSLTGAGDWPRSYEAQVREAYLGNPVAQRAVRLVAEGCAGAMPRRETAFEAPYRRCRMWFHSLLWRIRNG